MRGRHQVLRHLDGALEALEGRRLVGLMIVEEADGWLPLAVWRDHLAELRSGEALAAALPHRSAEQRQTIREALFGVTTWQLLCASLNVPTEALLPEAHVVKSDALRVRTRGLREVCWQAKGARK
jgi:hypothetical protein